MAREVTRTGRAYEYERHDTARNTERTLAWVFAVMAVALGVIGLLRGFGILFGSDVAAEDAVGAGAQGMVNWHAGLLWMLPAIASAFVAVALNFTEFNHPGELRDSGEEKLFKTGAMLSYVLMAGAIAAGVLALLIGFDVFDRGNIPGDGFLWGVAAIISGGASIAPRMAGHRATVADEDYIVRIVEDRVAATGTARTTTTRPVTDQPGDRIR